MNTLWDQQSRHQIMRRVESLDPASQPLWGRMNATEMLAHLLEGMRAGLGELPTENRKSIFRFWPLKYVFVYWLPFPRGAPAPRELVTRKRAVDWNESLVAFRGTMQRFASRKAGEPWPEHPDFGKLSGRAWGALGWRHLDHHLRQFGL